MTTETETEIKPVVVHPPGWHTPETRFRLLDVQSAMNGVNARLDAQQLRMEGIDDRIQANHLASQDDRKRLEDKLDSNSSLTSELLEIVKAGKGFFKVIGWIMTAIKWAAAIAIPIVGLIAVLKSGAPIK